jgi:hypothetical protein
MLFFEISASRTVRSADFSSSVFSRSWSRVELRSFSVTPRREVSPCTFISRLAMLLRAVARSLSPNASRRWRSDCSALSLVSSSPRCWRAAESSLSRSS